MVEMSKKMLAMLQEVYPEIVINGPTISEKRLCNILSVQFPKKIEGDAVVMFLSRKGIHCSTGSACSSDSLEPSHVITALGGKSGKNTVRFSISRETTQSDLEQAILAVRDFKQTQTKSKK